MREDNWSFNLHTEGINHLTGFRKLCPFASRCYFFLRFFATAVERLRGDKKGDGVLTLMLLVANLANTK